MLESFYSHLKPITTLADIWEVEYFAQVPGDWWFVGIQTLKNPSGLGSLSVLASLAAFMNRTSDWEIPGVYLGQILVLLIPTHILPELKDTLATAFQRIYSTWGIELKAGALLVSEITETGATLEVGRHSLGLKKSRPLIWGTGLSLGLNRIQYSQYEIDTKIPGFYTPDFEGLHRNFMDLNPKKDEFYTLGIVHTGGKSNRSDFKDLIGSLFPRSSHFPLIIHRDNLIFTRGEGGSNPILNLLYPGFWNNLWHRLQEKTHHFLLHFSEITGTNKSFHPPGREESLPTWGLVGEVLYLHLDLSHPERLELEDRLTRLRSQGLINFHGVSTKTLQILSLTPGDVSQGFSFLDPGDEVLNQVCNLQTSHFS